VTSPTNIDEQAAQSSASGRRLGFLHVRLVGLLALAAAVVLVSGAVFGGAQLWASGSKSPAVVAQADAGTQPGTEADTGPKVSWERAPVSADGLVDRLGVRVVQVALTGGGGLLDLRYQVIDADKAAGLHDPATPPAIVEEGTGLVAKDLLMGHAHSEGFKAGVTYYFVFENPGNLVKPGDRVSILLGGIQVEHIDVK
jgi:hypothetical protein